MYDNFVNGERYARTPQLVEDFVANLPIMDIPHEKDYLEGTAIFRFSSSGCWRKNMAV